VTNIVLPVSLLTPTAAQPASTGVPATVSNPSPALAQLAAGTVLRGKVTGHDARGHVLVRTNEGTLVLSTTVQLAVGSQVSLQVRTAGSQLLISVMQVDGHPASAHPHAPTLIQTATTPTTPGPGPGSGQGPGTAATTAAAPNPPGTPGAQAAASGGAHDTLALGQSVRAVVQSAAIAPQGGQPLLEPGATLNLRIVAFQPAPAGGAVPGTAATASGGPAGQAIPTSGAIQAGAGMPAQAGSLGPAVQAGPAATPLAGGVQTPVPPAATAPAQALASSDGAAATLSGAVTGVDGGGRTLVETPAGRLMLHLKAQLPAGSRLEFTWAAAPSAEATARLTPGPATLVHGWPALDEALQTLAGANAPPGALPLPHVPQPGGAMTSNLLFFLSALSAGDLASWLGRAALEALATRGRGDLAARLVQEFGQLGRLAEAAGDDWRFLPIPIYDGQQVQQIRLFLRQRRGQGEAGEGGEEATRFIVEVELSRLGDLQLDGLVRVQRFDLILRTRTALPQVMRDDITAIFREASEIGGYRGQIAFQASDDWDFLPLEVKAAAAPALVV
jgi:hypothetical protein